MRMAGAGRMPPERRDRREHRRARADDGGASPALARWIRTRVAETVGTDMSVVSELLDEARSRMKISGKSTETLDWAQILEQEVVPLVRRGHVEEARSVLRQFVDG